MPTAKTRGRRYSSKNSKNSPEDTFLHTKKYTGSCRNNSVITSTGYSSRRPELHLYI